MANEENLREWQKVTKVEEVRAPRYKSVHSPKTKPTYSTFCKNEPSFSCKKDTSKRMAPLPTQSTNNNGIVIADQKNYLVSNALDVIDTDSSKQFNRTPAKAKPIQYRNKPDYGKVPEYLNRVKGEIEDEKAVLAEYFDEGNYSSGPATESMAESDRQALIEQLQKTWDSVNREFLGLCGGSDSRNKVRRRDELAEQLKVIEADIKLLKSKGPIKIVLDH